MSLLFHRLNIAGYSRTASIFLYLFKNKIKAIFWYIVSYLGQMPQVWGEKWEDNTGVMLIYRLVYNLEKFK